MLLFQYRFICVSCQISQYKIIEWFYVNKVISEEPPPDPDDELSIKKWFAKNVKGDVISLFGEIKESEKITMYVFGLLHSMSHAFIKTAGEISGLAENSLTEIIIVETASIFVYAQTIQEVPLGALSGMAENNYAQFLNKVYVETRNCVFDPICTDRDDTSCSACLIICAEHLTESIFQTRSSECYSSAQDFAPRCEVCENDSP